MSERNDYLPRLKSVGVIKTYFDSQNHDNKEFENLNIGGKF